MSLLPNKLAAYLMPREVLMPIDFVVTEIKSIIFNQPRTSFERATPVNVSGSLKCFKTLPNLIPFHCAFHVIATPQVGFHLPTEVVVLLQRPPAEIDLRRWTPNYQRHWGVVFQAVHHSDFVFWAEEVVDWFYCRNQSYDGCKAKNNVKALWEFHVRIWDGAWVVSYGKNLGVL